jgi:hypothetical protein
MGVRLEWLKHAKISHPYISKVHLFGDSAFINPYCHLKHAFCNTLI